jgi:hypothetical protein
MDFSVVDFGKLDTNLEKLRNEKTSLKPVFLVLGGSFNPVHR